MKRSAKVMSFVLACAVTPVIAQTQPANPGTPPAVTQTPQQTPAQQQKQTQQQKNTQGTANRAKGAAVGAAVGAVAGNATHLSHLSHATWRHRRITDRAIQAG